MLWGQWKCGLPKDTTPVNLAGVGEASHRYLHQFVEGLRGLLLLLVVPVVLALSKLFLPFSNCDTYISIVDAGAGTAGV